MLQTFDKLTKMLTQEKRLGYKNTAIMGGFQKLAPNWVAEALEEAPNDKVRGVVQEIEQHLLEYSQIDESDRPTYLHQILVKLHKTNERVKVKQVSSTKQPAETKSEPDQPDSSTSAKEASNSSPSTPSPPPQPTEAPSQSTQSRPPTPQPSPYKPERTDEFENTGLDSPVTRLPGIKAATASKLANLGITTVGDFLDLHPRRYDDYRALKPINQLHYGEEVTIIAQVWETRKRDLKNNRSLVTAVLSDGTATIEATWFNQPWLVNKIRSGMQIVISGKVNAYLGRLNFQSPDWEELDSDLIHTGRIVPIYPLTAGITAKWLRQQIKRTVDFWTPRLEEPLPTELVDRLKIPPIGEAVRQVHFPDDWEKLETARRRLAFDELLLIQLAVLRQRQLWQEQTGHPVDIQDETVQRVVRALPFELTQAQHKVITEIVVDLKSATPMNRLLQGDVGAGKTVVALIAMILTALDNGQAAMLAPTEILAEQHFQGMQKLLKPISDNLGQSFEMRLLTGSTSATDRQEIAESLETGRLHILVGTHAIIQETVNFQNLRLAVVDEQHRFGVEQRANLRRKGDNPHMLVMTATPIPRTLALTIYGDLDVSVIDELPPGRQHIETHWLKPKERERAYSFINSQVSKGHQAFIICPLVEESDKLEAKSAVEEHKRLQKNIFPKLNLGLLHGRLKPAEKDQVMRAFRNREVDVLVSTSVVEVGIDVPNATVMLVEGANRFGLSQLHQFRGRVGRGEHKSYCLLLADNAGPEAVQRLQVLETTSNGFELAEEDLKLRGPGEFFGTRQSGLPDMKFVKMSDTRLLEVARREAQFILNEDPNLEQPQYQKLLEKLNNFWKARSDINQ